MSRTFFTFASLICLFAAWPTLSQETPGPEVRQLVQMAQELALSKKFDQAVEVMRKAVQKAPGNDLVLALTSDIELKAGKYADGLEHAQQAIKINDKVGPYYVLAAANAHAAQDFAKAREYCNLVLKAGPQVFGNSACYDMRLLDDLLHKKTYTLFWILDPQKGRMVGGVLSVAMPKNNLPYQTVTYEITGARSHRLIKGDVNDIVQIVPQGNQMIALTTKITVQPYSFKEALARAEAKPLPPEARVYLGPSYSIDPKSPALLQVVADLKGKNNVETARNIIFWMKRNIEYKRDKKGIGELDFKIVDEIVKRGHAECRGYALLFTGLCRTAGIPSRPVWGMAYIPVAQLGNAAPEIASHNWSEIYVPGCGWIPVDPQKPESIGCLPTSSMRFFMDAQKSKTSPEALPLINLVLMNGEKLKFEESR
jgi:tetratricopeptide (TPR) repeat protein